MCERRRVYLIVAIKVIKGFHIEHISLDGEESYLWLLHDARGEGWNLQAVFLQSQHLQPWPSRYTLRQTRDLKCNYTQTLNILYVKATQINIHFRKLEIFNTQTSNMVYYIGLFWYCHKWQYKKYHSMKLHVLL